MPIYEYRCEACGTRFSVLFWPPEQPRPRCRRCGSTRASRLVSRVALLRGEEERLEKLAEKAAGIDEADEAGLERWAREVERELGEEVPGDAAHEDASGDV
jgi:putative FmdB family regulatory protein